MTDRHRGYVVTLSEDLREDDAAVIIEAIKSIKYVLSVDPIVTTLDIQLAQARVRQELGEKLMKVLYGDVK